MLRSWHLSFSTMRFCVTSSENASPAMAGAIKGTETGFTIEDVRWKSVSVVLILRAARWQSVCGGLRVTWERKVKRPSERLLFSEGHRV